MYRKIRKADWVAECQLCGVVAHSVDEFGAYAANQRHYQSMGHVAKALDKAFAPVTEGLQRLGSIVSDVVAAMTKAQAVTRKDFALAEFYDPFEGDPDARV